MMRQELIHNDDDRVGQHRIPLGKLLVFQQGIGQGDMASFTTPRGLAWFRSDEIGTVSLLLLVKVFRLDDSHKNRNETTPNPFT